MSTKFHRSRWIAAVALGGTVAFLAGCQSMAPATSEQVTLLGANEVPPVTTSASGSGMVTIKADGGRSARISRSPA